VRFAPIAIVGQGCVVPGAGSAAALHELVFARRDALSPPPAGRVRMSSGAAFGAPEWANGRPWTAFGGYVTGFSADAESEELRALDVSFHWLLRAAREALGPVGHTGRSARAGLIIGNLSFPTGATARFAERVWLDEQGLAAACEAAGLVRPAASNRFMSWLPARLVATALGLDAPGHALDAACASSLYAIKLACDRLHDGSADLMVAGAVNAADPLILHAGFTALAALSRSGRSLPFNKGADGLVPAEGAAVVVIKRLADARAAGDRVLGVIRGIGLSNDGRGRGFLAPSEAGQVRAMRAAYASAEMSPAAVSLLECHATGTLVGDAAEVHSTQEVFAAAGVDELAIGSLKSNLGHLVTAAGAAGIIKVLGGFAAGLRPPMLGTEAPIDVLIDSPFRLVAEAERWGAEGPRVAAVSAFGFGGNNAHLIISEEDPGIEATRFIAVRPAPRIAVVAIGARVGDTTGAEAAARALLLDLPWSARRTEVELAIEGLKFPPRVIEQALPQQLLVLEAAREATAGLTLPRERTGVFVGIGCDPEIARHGLRWRLADLVARWSARTGSPVPSEWLSAARRGVDPELTAEAVVGSLPNIPANRINVQLDLAGPGHTVSAEQASGVVALRIAARALREGELDAAIVGASDLSQEAVHRAALAELGERHATGDAAVVLVLRRLADAQAAGQPVLAVLEEGFDVEPERGSGAGAAGREGTGEAPCFGDGEGAVDPCVRGVAHAAAGLMHVAAAVMSVHHGVRPVGGKAMPWLGERRATTRTRVLAGNDETVIVSGVGPAAALRSVRPRLYVYGGADRRGVLQALADGRESQDGPARLVIAAADERERQALAVQARHAVEHGARLPEGAAYRDAPIGGELAFVFTGAAASYWGMGRELAAALPEIMRQLETRYVHLAGATAWIHGPTPAPGHPLDQLWASVFLCQLHAEVSRRVLGLAPQATIGYSSGETNALFASGAWRDIDAMARESRDSPVFATEIVGEFAAARRAWRRAGQGGGAWRTWSVAAPVARVREALQDEPLAHLTIINTPEDCVIGGEAGACERVIDRVGRERGLPLGYEMMAHCPEIEEIRAAWYELHHRATWAVPGVRHYSAGRTGAFTATAEAAAAAITAQALTTLDLPRMIEQAYADGVRVFVEHGPRGLCSGWIRRILGDREHVAVSLDAAGRDGVRQLANAAAGLIAAGVAVDREGLARALGTEVVGEAGAVLRVPAHSTIAIPPLAGGVQVMPLAPVLVPVLESAAVSAPGRATEHAVGSTVVLESAVRGHAIATPEVVAGTRLRSPLHAVHGEFLAAQAAAHTQFLAMRQRMQDTLLRTYTGASGPRYDAGASGPRIDAGMHGPRFDAVDEPRVDVPVVGAAIAVAADAGHPGLRMDRAALEVHASGALSAVFGPAFAELDGLRRRVRMPMPPLLLADRVTGIAAEPLGHGTGTLWTETDVREDSWYLHDGRMPAGIMIESGQADLLLASWIGVDQHNRGERVYRLLGCELTYHGELPRPGETLVYDIHIDAHAQQGDVRLFFFHYDCRVDGALRLSVRHGQAGFFTDEELAGSGGVLWDAATTAGTEGRAGRRAGGGERGAGVHGGAAAGVRGRASGGLLRGGVRDDAGARAVAADPVRPTVAAARGHGVRRERRAVGARVPARRGGDRGGRLVLRGALSQRPVHARDADVRGLRAGDGVLSGGARVHDRPRRVALRAGAGADDRDALPRAGDPDVAADHI
jgi:acyl transferase domain-containing protein